MVGPRKRSRSAHKFKLLSIYCLSLECALHIWVWWKMFRSERKASTCEGDEPWRRESVDIGESVDNQRWESGSIEESPDKQRCRETVRKWESADGVIGALVHIRNCPRRRRGTSGGRERRQEWRCWGDVQVHLANWKLDNMVGLQVRNYF